MATDNADLGPTRKLAILIYPGEKGNLEPKPKKKVNVRGVQKMTIVDWKKNLQIQ
jgi:hypothetical protein